MEILFLELLKVSLLCSAGIVLIFGVSRLLQKTHTVYWRYCLWALLAVRLILPFDFSIATGAVVVPLPDWVPAEDFAMQQPAGGTGSDGIRDEKEGSVKTQNVKAAADKREDGRTQSGEVKEPTDGNSEMRAYETKDGETGDKESRSGGERDKKTEGPQEQGLRQVSSQESDSGQKAGAWNQIFWWASVIWAAGAAALLGWQVVCYMNFARKVKRTRRFLASKENLPVYISGAAASPMLMGLRNPQIVLPDRAYAKEQLALILDHEYTHYRRKDLWVRLLLALARTLHWFNPLVAWMERQAVQDMELLCDSRVVEGFSREEKKRYGQTLLDCAAAGKNGIRILGTSEFSRDVKTIKERFTNLFSGEGKKRGVTAVVAGAACLLSVSLFVVFGAPGNGVGKASSLGQENFGPEAIDTELATSEENVKKAVPVLLGLTEEEAAKAVYGAVFPRLVYASDERAVLYDYWGLLIYDLENGRIEQILDLKSAELNHIQGDQVTHVEVSADGGQILLYNEPNAQERFVYDIDEKRLAYSELDTFTENHYDGLYERGERNYALTQTGKAVYLSADSLQTTDGEVYHSGDMQGLSLVTSGPEWGKSKIYPLFSDYYEKLGDEVFCRLKMEDFDRIVGKRYLYGDKDGWSYYLEEDVNRESVLWDIAEVLEPLLLTRYRNGERQVLEDLIYHEAFLECPVLFVEGRIVYKAAQTADIVGVKEVSLVSIAADGSDRRVADTALYHVFDGVCEDDGWIYYSGWTNADSLPKPLCRISPDFSSGAQLVEEIPGYLCGVMDGYVYYLAGRDKKPGVWKRNLETGEEQIYDKWGIFAEDIRLFWARELQYPAGELRDEAVPGCRMLYFQEYDGEIGVCNLPFDSED